MDSGDLFWCKRIVVGQTKKIEATGHYVRIITVEREDGGSFDLNIFCKTRRPLQLTSARIRED